MGYIPVYQEIDDPFPTDVASRFAGVVLWLNASVIKEHRRLETFLKTIRLDGIPFVFFDSFSRSENYRVILLVQMNPKSKNKKKISLKNKLFCLPY